MIKRMILLALGCALAAAAFAAAAFEGMAHLQGAPQSVFLSAHDLWYAYRPASLVIAQGTVERSLHPAVWAWGVRPALALPAWLLLGAPGLLMIWRGRTRTAVPDDDRVDTLDIYDQLARRAEAEGYGADDDMAPDHGAHTAFATATENDVDELERLMQAAEAARLGDAPPAPPGALPPEPLPAAEAAPLGPPVLPPARGASPETGLNRPLLPPKR